MSVAPTSIDQTIVQIAAGADPRDQPIPVQQGAGTAGQIGRIEVASRLRTDPLVNLLDNGFCGVSYYYSEARHNPLYGTNIDGAEPTVLVRKPLVDALRKVNQFLAQFDAELFVLDGYRKLKTQRRIRECFIDQLVNNRNLDSEQAEVEADKYYSRAPRDIDLDYPDTWFAHCTGGAIDMSLQSRNGVALEMGSIFDGIDESIQTAYYETHQPNTFTEIAAQRNRRLLYWATLAAGEGKFVNYPYEFFHFDYFTNAFATRLGILNARNLWPDSLRSANVGPCPSDGNWIS